jgi:predicted GNAT family acetyltransferase
MIGRMEDKELTVTHDEASSRYEIDLGGQKAVADYGLSGDGTMMFTHTEVPRQHTGRGVASRLIKFALDDARERGRKVLPYCSFVSAYIRRHPEYKELVLEEKRAQFNL